MADGAVALDTDGKRRFAAFISYAHADAAIAAKLQAKLERYRLPKHIAQGRAGGGAALGQIFRDREDLAAAPSLSDAIRAAIAEAEALVVICSPEARASRWVGEEIALFHKLHPGRPVLAAIVRGEPGEAFPDALTAGGNEPLAADLRAGGDGEALGFLKIVAGIAAVPLDALVQRDAQRRLRRVMWITGGALAAMLVMAVMTTLALQARNEAARQRAEAEGLVEYMLTDLREKLKGVGRLDVMGAVNERAKAYYGNGSVKSRVLDAQVLHAMGEDLDKQGQIDKAQERFNAAYRATADLLNSHPNNPDVIFTHAQSEYWVGYTKLRKGDRQTALKYWKAYAALATRLAALEPQSIRSLMERGYSEASLCDVNAKDPNSLEKANSHCSLAVGFMDRAWKRTARDPIIGDALANNYGWLADVSSKKSDLKRAAEMRDKEASVYIQLLKADPENRQYWRRLATSRMGSGRNLYKMRNYYAALIPMREAEALFAKLVAEEPDNAENRVWRLRNIIHIIEAVEASDSGTTAKERAMALDILTNLIKIGAIPQHEEANYLQRIG